MEDENSKEGAQQRWWHVDDPDWSLEKAGIVAYCISIVAIIVALHANYPWWAIVLGMPLVLIAGVGCMGLVAVPFLLPFYAVRWVMEHLSGKAKSRDQTNEQGAR